MGYYWIRSTSARFIRTVACVGSGDPVRDLSLSNLCATLQLDVHRSGPNYELTLTLHGVVSFIVTYVDVGRTVFRDRSQALTGMLSCC